MNTESSRSHSIFTIIIEASENDGSETKYRMGKLNLVDLAGSERQSKTGTRGEEFKQATKINLSLTLLGNVICALVNPKTTHIPYRESKLTMLLCDSLGGNTKTVMIANVGPADYNYEETLNTLWYANRAKNIKNKPKINEDPKDALLRQYQEEIETLKKQLNLGPGGVGGLGKREIETKIVYVEDEQNLKALEENLEKQKQEHKAKAEKEIEQINQQKNLAEETKIQLIDQINNKANEQKKIRDEQRSLVKKMQEMKKKIINPEIEQKVKEQEEQILETKKKKTKRKKPKKKSLNFN